MKFILCDNKFQLAIMGYFCEKVVRQKSLDQTSVKCSLCAEFVDCEIHFVGQEIYIHAVNFSLHSRAKKMKFPGNIRILRSNTYKYGIATCKIHKF